MSNWFLLIILLFLSLFSYIINGKKIGPPNILELGLLVPTLVLILMNDYIQYELCMESVIVIFIILIMFQIGDFISRVNMIEKKIYSRRCSNVIVKHNFALLAVAFQVFYLFLCVTYILKVGAEYGVTNFFGAFAANRINTVAIQKTGVGIVDVQPSSINVICMYIANSIEIVSLHVILIQKIIMRTRIDKCLLFSVLLYLMTLLIDGGRASLVPFIIHLLYITILLTGLSVSSFINQNRFKIIVMGAILAAFFIASGTFRQAGPTNNSNDVEVIDLENSFATYVASPLMGFDLYIKNGMGDYNYFGQHIFKGVYDVVRRLGVDIERNKKHQENFSHKHIESNAHNAVWFWIKDFRLFGAFIFSLSLGLFYGFISSLERRNVIRMDNIIGCYVISRFYWALIMSFFGNMYNFFFSLDFLYILFIMYFIIKFRFIVFYNDNSLVK